jgi:hypothetical protein
LNIKSNFSSSQATLGRFSWGRIGWGQVDWGQVAWGRVNENDGGEMGEERWGGGCGGRVRNFLFLGIGPKGAEAFSSHHIWMIFCQDFTYLHKHFLIHLSLIEFDSKVLVI